MPRRRAVLLGAELEAALAARRRLSWHEVWKHGRPARDLARAHGLGLLADHIEGAMAGGCFAAAAKFHSWLALVLLDERPARPILTRRATLSPAR